MYALWQGAGEVPGPPGVHPPLPGGVGPDHTRGPQQGREQVTIHHHQNFE